MSLRPHHAFITTAITFTSATLLSCLFAGRPLRHFYPHEHILPSIFIFRCRQEYRHIFRHTPHMTPFSFRFFSLRQSITTFHCSSPFACRLSPLFQSPFYYFVFITLQRHHYHISRRFTSTNHFSTPARSENTSFVRPLSLRSSTFTAIVHQLKNIGSPGHHHHTSYSSLTSSAPGGSRHTNTAQFLHILLNITDIHTFHQAFPPSSVTNDALPLAYQVISVKI